MKPSNSTGLELMQAFVAGGGRIASISETMAMRPVEVTRGAVVFEATPDARHLNPMGGVHGGYACTVLDSVTGCAVHTMLEAGASYGTVDLAVKMLRPLKVGQTYRAEGRVLNVSTRLGVSEGSILDADGKLVAHATCTCLITRPAPASSG
ncbi:MAG: phenylacetic acid degradation protein [Panacagrimonas sp.]|jgi:uncharacterized protein (TIGR00369 family)|nr:PaaI family thioesterase [Panacagrimonas sp.]MCC2657857.1 phenylacetic acid degradation protein [Panacagrimonas sp.]